jgi:hypothetical protein
MAAALCAKASDTHLSFYVRSLMLRQLTPIGRAESVAPLEALLNDPDAHIRESAREDLERNPDSKAGEVLREALAKGGDTRWQIGLINSLGTRRDEAAVKAIAAKTCDGQICGVALSALGKIGTPEAVAALQKALPAPAAGQALIVAARQFAKENDVLNARAAYSSVYTASISPGLCAAALSGLARPIRTRRGRWSPRVSRATTYALRQVAVSSLFTVYGSKGAVAAAPPATGNIKKPGSSWLSSGISMRMRKARRSPWPAIQIPTCRRQSRMRWDASDPQRACRCS